MKSLLSYFLIFIVHLVIGQATALAQTYVPADESWLQREVNLCKNGEVRLPAVVRLHRSLVIARKCSIVGNGSKVILGSGLGQFDNTDPLNRLASNAVGLLVFKANGVKLSGFSIYKEQAKDGTFVKAIYIRESTSVTIDGLLVQGFNLGGGHITISSSKNSIVRNTTIRGAYSNLDRELSSKALAQMTGIEIDNDLFNGVPSTDLTIENNRIYGFEVGSAYLRRYGNQTDGINIANPMSQSHDIKGNFIQGLAEGIDVYGADNVIVGNTILGARYFAIKLIHGAQRNEVTNNFIDSARFVGIIIAGANGFNRPTRDNLIKQNRIENSGYPGPSSEWEHVAAIMVIDYSSHNLLVNNVVELNSVAYSPLYETAYDCRSGVGTVFKGNSHHPRVVNCQDTFDI